MENSFLYPLIGAGIGYATNYLAIKMVIKWLIPRRKGEIKRKMVDEIVPQFLPAYVKRFSPVKKKFLRDTAEMMAGMKIEELVDIILSDSKELQFVKILGGVIGAVVGGVTLLI